MYIQNYFLVIVPELILILAFTLLVRKKKFFFDIIDTPDNIRKLHDQPTSSTGGFFILIAVLYLLILDLLNFQHLNHEINFYLEGFKSKISF